MNEDQTFQVILVSVFAIVIFFHYRKYLKNKKWLNETFGPFLQGKTESNFLLTTARLKGFYNSRAIETSFAEYKGAKVLTIQSVVKIPSFKQIPWYKKLFGFKVDENHKIFGKYLQTRFSMHTTFIKTRKFEDPKKVLDELLAACAIVESGNFKI